MIIDQSGIRPTPCSGVDARPQRRLERGQRHLVHPAGPHQRVDSTRPIASPAPDHDPALRAAQELVAGEEHEVGPGREALGDGRLVHRPRAAARPERPRADVVDHPEAVVVRKLDQVRQCGPPR